MTVASVLAAAKTQLTTALAAVSPAFVTVGLLEDQPTPWTPDLYPMCLLAHEEERETRFGVAVGTTPGGDKKSVWELCAYLWHYEGGPTWDEATFLGYVETVKHTLRNNHTLNAAAGTSTTFVLTSSEDGGDGTGIRSTSRSIKDGSGGVTRYAEVRCLIREGIYA